MHYVAPRSMTVVSLSGRSARLEKGVPTYCPPQMHGELIAQGIVPAEPIDEVDEPTSDAGAEPQVPAERETALFDAFDIVALRAKREDFTAVGMPHLSVLAKVLGWSVNGKERDAAWGKYTLSKAAV